MFLCYQILCLVFHVYVKVQHGSWSPHCIYLSFLYIVFMLCCFRLHWVHGEIWALSKRFGWSRACFSLYTMYIVLRSNHLSTFVDFRILYQEIDYINEGKNADRLRRDFRNIKWVRVPVSLLLRVFTIKIFLLTSLFTIINWLHSELVSEYGWSS